MKTFGTVSTEDGSYVIRCEPHVAIKLKGLFSKIAKNQFGRLTLKATEENSRDLEWFLQRYPMVVDDPRTMMRKAREYDRRMDTVARIVSGDYSVPEYDMALPPREYQRTAAAVVWTLGGMLLGDEIGLGKTVSALTVLSNPKTLPAVVVCPTHLPRQWQREANRFLPGLKTHIVKKGKPYQIDTSPDVVIINYHKIAGWAEVLAARSKTVIFDECQELRRATDGRGNATAKYAAASHVAAACEYRMGLSATPIYNYGGEFHNIFECLAPGLLGSKEEFTREWCDGFSYGFDKVRIKDPTSFGTYLLESGRMLLRTKRDVGRELPALTRVIHEVESDERRLENVESAAVELANFIVNQPKADGFSVMRASQEFSNAIRQATGIAKAPHVAMFVDMMLSANPGEKVLLFGWHREVYAIWAECLRRHQPAWFTGSESPAKKQKEAERFMTDPACRVMMMSLRAGSGIDGLQRVCSRVVFGELDWSPGAMEQCSGRAHRDGQEDPVFAYYLTAADGADPVMMDVLGIKKAQLEGVIDPKGANLGRMQVDPDHVKRLAEAYLVKRKRLVSDQVVEGGKLDQILKSRPERLAGQNQSGSE